MTYKMDLGNGVHLVGKYDGEKGIFSPYGSISEYYRSKNIKEITSCDECMEAFNPFYRRCPAVAYNMNDCPKQDTDEFKTSQEKQTEKRIEFVSRAIEIGRRNNV